MTTSAGNCTVLDFDPREADAEATARTRRLLGRVLSTQGPTGLARALHVSAPRAAQLKHRVVCVTCRSRLDALATSLSAACSSQPAIESDALPPLDCPAPLTAWLAVDSGRGLEPAPRALRDPGALAAFLAAFGSGEGDAAEAASASGGGGGGRRSGRSGGVDRCFYHAPRPPLGAKAPGTSAATIPASPTNGGCAVACVLASAAGAGAAPGALAPRERERYVAILEGSTTDAEWRQLGSVDIDSAMCDLFSWLGDRGLCSACVDAVTGALLEVRRAVTGNCTCSRCLGLCGARKNQKALQDGAAPAEADAGAAPSGDAATASGGPARKHASTSTAASTGGRGTPELLRVQGQLRAICGVYRREALPFNGKPVYKKERAEAYLLYTSLKDWMVSGRADAGGSRCEGWAYVTDPAETPDEVCGVWKVSGPKGWEEDSTLCVTVFEGLPEDMREGLGYDDGSFIARRLAADDRGMLLVPLQEREVLEEVLFAPDEPPSGGEFRSVHGGCSHITTAEMAQRELRCWLRWLLRERLDAQRRRVLAQAQVGASLCRLFACAALQQLEQAAEEPPMTPQRPQKKGRASKKAAKEAAAAAAAAATKGAVAVGDDAASSSLGANDDATSSPEVEAPIATQGEARAGSGAAACSTAASSASASKPGGGGDSSGALAPWSAGSSSSSGAGLLPGRPDSSVGAVHCGQVDSDESASSTRASSEEPPNAHSAELALGARRLMEQMGWRPEAVDRSETLGSTEVAAWHEQHPCYRQVVHEERERRKSLFQKWAGAPVR